MADAAPPALPGYDHLRELGHGGFADVHLYRQHLPSREVAVKVLRDATRTQADRDQFENETNRMAMLSSHPGIVTIYEVGVAPDGRPFLTMEFCPNDHFGSIARAHPLTVTRALEVGIKVAAAVETAHHASILHRDIKPANILVTAYGEPALTDFGIAGGGEADEAVSQGVSIPFAAPEVLAGSTTGDERSDVYSLGATVYALLAGRSPFSTGVRLTDAELIARILHAPLPPTGRADLPPTLEGVLATALARDPANRYDSAAAFGRALQGVEAGLGLAQTPLRIADTSAVPPPRPVAPGDDDSTRFRSLQRVDPDGTTATRPGPATPITAPTAPSTTVPTAPTAPTSGAPWSTPLPTVDPAPAPVPVPSDTGLGDRTVARRGEPTPDRPSASAATAPAPPEAGADGRRRTILAIIGAVVVLAVAGLLVAQLGGGTDGGTDATTTTPGTEPLVLGDALRRPERVRITRVEGGGQVITWTAPGAAEGDTYQVSFTAGPRDLRDEPTDVRERTLQIDTDQRVCVVVEALRGGRLSDASTEACTR